MLNVIYYQIPGLTTWLEIEIEEDTIIRIAFCTKALNGIVEGDFERDIVRQLDAYFSGNSDEFDLAFFATGSSFQLQVWEAVLKIPYGETISYQALALQIGKANAARAVGNALNANPVPILVPCHRVIGSDGSLKGFAGGLEVKRYLLGLEHKVAGK